MAASITFVRCDRPPAPQSHDPALRARVWLHRSSLDGRLAGGEHPAARRELSLRAEQLVSPGFRERLAADLGGVLDAAEDPPPPLSSSAPLRRAAILAARPALLALARELRAPGPVHPQGVALTRALLVDSASPLYAPAGEGALERSIEGARCGLGHHGREY